MKSSCPSMLPPAIFLASLAIGTSCSDDPWGTADHDPRKGVATKAKSRPKPNPRPARKQPGLNILEYGPAPVVELQTSMGPIELTLFTDKAPKTVQTILSYCIDGFYEGTRFHKVIPGYCIAGGAKIKTRAGRLATKPPTYASIPDETGSKLPEERGAVVMSRDRRDVNSATSQFIILLQDKEPGINAKGRTVKGKSTDYMVFGQVTKGMDIVDKIAALPTMKSAKGIFKNPPVIRTVTVRRDTRDKGD